MSARSATNNGKVNGESVAKKTAPATKPAPKSIATRVEELEAEVAALKNDVNVLKGLLDRVSRVLAGMIENQAVAAALPAVEQRLRAEVQQRFSQGGLGALMGEESEQTAQPS